MVMRNQIQAAEQGASSGPGSWGSNPCPAAINFGPFLRHSLSVGPTFVTVS
jgi:hypothetical protein